MSAETPAAPPPPVDPHPPTPLSWRVALAVALLLLVGLAYLLSSVLPPAWGSRAQAAIGVVCFIGAVALFSSNLRAVNWRTVGWGFALQLLLGLFIIKLDFEVGGVRIAPGQAVFGFLGEVVKQFLDFTSAGNKVVFGILADPAAMDNVFAGRGFVFAFMALPTIIFVSAIFSTLYHFGVLQFIVRILARGMMYLMRTSGAETLSAGANVFMGQTEAPLIVKPFIPKMTQSELLAMMVGGMATIAGGVMAVYIGLGADPVAILATSVMAAPCGLYLSKLMLPELGKPETLGTSEVKVERPHATAIDAFASGASDGLSLTLNVAAMLIAFLAGLAMIDFLLNLLGVGVLGWPDKALSLSRIFSWVFSPVAFLLGLQGSDVPQVAELLGIKLAANEFIAYIQLKDMFPAGDEAAQKISKRAHKLATYALTGFANFGSIGIQLGGIGAMAPNRRKDLARLSVRALFVGFVATLVNAAVAGLLMDD